MTKLDPDYPVMSCPKCGHEENDFDGFGFMYCEKCEYCSHPTYTNDVCDICGERYVQEQSK